MLWLSHVSLWVWFRISGWIEFSNFPPFPGATVSEGLYPLASFGTVCCPAILQSRHSDCPPGPEPHFLKLLSPPVIPQSFCLLEVFPKGRGAFFTCLCLRMALFHRPVCLVIRRAAESWNSNATFSVSLEPVSPLIKKGQRGGPRIWFLHRQPGCLLGIPSLQRSF